MTIRLLRPTELTPDLIAAWSAIQQSDAELESPYFRPEFTQVVAEVRDDVHVAVIEENGVPRGFFPFQPGPMGAGRPVSGRLSDYHGLIAGRLPELAPQELLRACGLRSWAFDHVPASQKFFADHATETADSTCLDISKGFEAYVADRRAAKAGDVKDVPAKIRKLERDHGAIRIEMVSDDQAAFDTLIRWKSEQYQRTGLSDVFAYPWTVRLIERIWKERSTAFAGWLTTMHVGERLIAVHFSMRSHAVLHSWFPGYDHEFSRYSPGTTLLYEMARLGAESGITKIDLGKGAEKYKHAFANGHRLLAEGSISRSQISKQVDASWRSLRTWLKTGPLSVPAQASARVLRPIRERRSFQ